MRKKVRIGPQPSISAASSSTRGQFDKLLAEQEDEQPAAASRKSGHKIGQ